MDFDSILAMVAQLSASIPGKTAVFYRGLAPTNPYGFKWNSELATFCAGEFANNFYTIGDTPVGQYLTNTLNLNDLVSEGILTSAQKQQIWAAASRIPSS